ncbi:MAG: terpene cyclase/mutase family protein [Planctomycetota bacterium]|nr:terpene cyclase/mutase family protein [Planctomycetota bacterium]
MRMETRREMETEPAEVFPPVGAPGENLELEGTFTESLIARMGGAPWWIISGAFHALLLLLLTLIGMAVMRSGTQDIVITTNLEKQKPPEYEETRPRDVFKNPVPVESELPPVEHPVVTHEEVEVADHRETADEMEDSKARGDENSISDVPLGGTGVSASIGVGGGGGGAFGQRGVGGRRRLAAKGGGGQATESAVDAALRWLARHQEADGRWDCAKHGGKMNDLAVTGLALLAFLGAGHTEKVGIYKDHVKRAAAWIRTTQMPNGYYHQAGTSNGYAHAIASLAMAEAAGMGRVADTVQSAQKAVTYSCEIHQQGEGSGKLGWRYGPKEPGDLSVTGWFVMALKSAKVAGLKVPTQSIDGAVSFLDLCEQKGNANDPYGGHRYGYLGPGAGVRTTAIGCLCRQFLGWKKEELQGGVEFFVAQGGTPAWAQNGSVDLYYWYYGTLCVFQQGGDAWKRWNEALKKALCENQRKGGDEDGSWDPIGHFADEWGRAGQTAMGCLCLEVYYRYLPLYR